MPTNLSDRFVSEQVSWLDPYHAYLSKQDKSVEMRFTPYLASVLAQWDSFKTVDQVALDTIREPLPIPNALQENIDVLSVARVLSSIRSFSANRRDARHRNSSAYKQIVLLLNKAIKNNMLLSEKDIVSRQRALQRSMPRRKAKRHLIVVHNDSTIATEAIWVALERCRRSAEIELAIDIVDLVGAFESNERSRYKTGAICVLGRHEEQCLIDMLIAKGLSLFDANLLVSGSEYGPRLNLALLRADNASVSVVNSQILVKRSYRSALSDDFVVDAGAQNSQVSQFGWLPLQSSIDRLLFSEPVLGRQIAEVISSRDTSLVSMNSWCSHLRSALITGDGIIGLVEDGAYDVANRVGVRKTTLSHAASDIVGTWSCDLRIPCAPMLTVGDDCDVLFRTMIIRANQNAFCLCQPYLSPLPNAKAFAGGDSFRSTGSVIAALLGRVESGITSAEDYLLTASGMLTAFECFDDAQILRTLVKVYPTDKTGFGDGESQERRDVQTPNPVFRAVSVESLLPHDLDPHLSTNDRISLLRNRLVRFGRSIQAWQVARGALNPVSP